MIDLGAPAETAREIAQIANSTDMGDLREDVIENILMRDVFGRKQPNPGVYLMAVCKYLTVALIAYSDEIQGNN